MNGIKPDPDVKMEPEVGYMDDEFYEDTGELTLPPKHANQKDIWLARIPDWLYDAVSKWDNFADGPEDEQIQVGEVLAFPDQQTQGRLSQTRPMRVFLSERWRQKSQLPNAFELALNPTSDAVLGNTYVFTEKDLPGYKPNGLGAGKAGGSFGSVQDPKARVQKRSKYKKAIPKQTSLLGHATRQYTATPLNTKEYLAFQKARTKQAIQGTNVRTNIIDTTETDNSAVQNRFKTFIRPAEQKKTQINKAARIPKNELIDMLHTLFDEYKYWPMKELKNRTKQPEAYLKEVLIDIAQLVRGGPFASTWMRLAMYEKNTGNVKEELAPETAGGDSGDEEEMEDVV